jgi:hypothetical protein
MCIYRLRILSSDMSFSFKKSGFCIFWLLWLLHSPQNIPGESYHFCNLNITTCRHASCHRALITCIFFDPKSAKKANIPVSVCLVRPLHLFSEFPSPSDAFTLLTCSIWVSEPVPIRFFNPKIGQKSKYFLFCVSDIIPALLQWVFKLIWCFPTA